MKVIIFYQYTLPFPYVYDVVEDKFIDKIIKKFDADDMTDDMIITNKDDDDEDDSKYETELKLKIYVVETSNKHYKKINTNSRDNMGPYIHDEKLINMAIIDKEEYTISYILNSFTETFMQ